MMHDSSDTTGGCGYRHRSWFSDSSCLSEAKAMSARNISPMKESIAELLAQLPAARKMRILCVMIGWFDGGSTTSQPDFNGTADQ